MSETRPHGRPDADGARLATALVVWLEGSAYPGDALVAPVGPARGCWMG